MGVINWKELVGKRVLLEYKDTQIAYEFLILETSHDGKYIKVTPPIFPSTPWVPDWLLEVDYKLVDVLDDEKGKND